MIDSKNDIWYPSAEQIAASNITQIMPLIGVSDYDELYRFSVDKPAEYWKAILQYAGVIWSKDYTEFSDLSAGPEFPKWFVGGALNWTDTIFKWAHEPATCDKVALIAHSMGSMFGTRFVLMHPQRVDRLVLEGPIGLEDYRLKVPYASKDELAREAAAVTREGINRFYRGYFVEWKPEYQVFADVAWRWTLGPGAERLARVAAHTYQMAYEQPVVYELHRIQVRTLLIGGNKDRSAIGRNRVAPEVRDSLGRFTELIPATAKSMPDARGVMLEGVGHIPHVESPSRFHELLKEFL